MYACPKCGSKELNVEIVTYADFRQLADGTIVTAVNADTADEPEFHEWTNESPMLCCNLDCEYSGPALDFFVEHGPAA